MKYCISLAFLFSPFFVISQCISGDCKNGFGKFDYGYAVYEGNFLNEKPNGQGTMDYGNGEKFVGNFKDGQEDGDGILYKNNVSQYVTYIDGKAKIKTSAHQIVGGNAPVIEGCKQGDCYNGFGILQFPNGNRYEGNFINGIKSGEGKFYFSLGNVFSGQFEEDIYTKGVFTYTKEAITFTGNFNLDGSPKTGDYYYAVNKATVTVLDGKITNVDNPVARRADSLALENSKPKSCYACSGAGMNAGQSKNVTVYRQIETKVGNRVEIYEYGNSYTRKEYTMPTECNVCKGTGQLHNSGTTIRFSRN